MKPFIGISKIWYGDPLTEEPTATSMSTLVSSMTEVKNSHQGTWSFTQDDPETTDYINELTGLSYYRDKESNGVSTIAFTMGVYEMSDKAALEGGSVINTSEGWKSSAAITNITKSIVAKTKTGNYIVFTNAAIIAKVDTQEKNLGLGVSATALENETDGISAVYMFDGAKVK